MVKIGYKDALQGTASVKVNINADGNIAQDGDTIVGTKTFNFTTTNADNSLEQNESVTKLFIATFLGGSYLPATQTFKVTWQADV